MALKSDFQTGLASLFVLNLMCGLAAIGLLLRATPSIETVVRSHVASVEAAEEMLAVIALSSSDMPTPALEQQFSRSLSRARDAATLPQERPILDTIEEHGLRAIHGDPSSVRAAVEQLAHLVSINREASIQTGEHIRFLGRAGVWAIVLITLTAFFLALAILSRSQRRLIDPLQEVVNTVEAARRGDPFRRCAIRDASGEMVRLMEGINNLLDHPRSFRQSLLEASHETTPSGIGSEPQTEGGPGEPPAPPTEPEQSSEPTITSARTES